MWKMASAFFSNYDNVKIYAFLTVYTKKNKNSFIYLAERNKYFTFAVVKQKTKIMNVTFASFYYFYFYFAGLCRAGSCV